MFKTEFSSAYVLYPYFGGQLLYVATSITCKEGRHAFFALGPRPHGEDQTLDRRSSSTECLGDMGGGGAIGLLRSSLNIHPSQGTS